ncbi:MAG: hypothetical protein LBM98_01360 [Oscillospiraceae bacterium]|nr:hypothetical protein [Oscillospiraceae bacterium]
MRRHCEPREAIQAQFPRPNLRIIQYYVNPGLLRRISPTTYRKCGGGFAMTGRASPCPVPAHCAGTLDVGCAAHGGGGGSPRRARVGGFETRPYEPPQSAPSATYVQTHRL